MVPFPSLAGLTLGRVATAEELQRPTSLHTTSAGCFSITRLMISGPNVEMVPLHFGKYSQQVNETKEKECACARENIE